MSDYRAWAQAGWVWHCCVRQEQERVHWTHGEVEDWEGCGPADRESCARILWGMMSSESVNNDKLMCNSVDLRPCDCAGCGRPTRLSVWCPRAGAGHCWNSGDWFIRLEKQYRIQRRYFFFFLLKQIQVLFHTRQEYHRMCKNVTAGYHNVTFFSSLPLKVIMTTT